MNRRSLQERLRLARKRRSGMTLTEIMIVIVIMTMIATAIGIAVIPKLQQAKIKQARIDAGTVRAAAESYMISGSGEGCPTIADLVRSGEIRGSGNTKDPWQHEFRIECRGGDITVTSAGPDGNFGGEDDVH